MDNKYMEIKEPEILCICCDKSDKVGCRCDIKFTEQDGREIGFCRLHDKVVY